MSWQNLFATVIGLAIVVRILFIAFGPMSIEDKLAKMGNWIAGIVLVSLSWLALNSVIGGAGGLFKNGGTVGNPNSAIIKTKDTKPTKDNNVQIIIDNKPEDN